MQQDSQAEAEAEEQEAVEYREVNVGSLARDVRFLILAWNSYFTAFIEYSCTLLVFNKFFFTCFEVFQSRSETEQSNLPLAMSREM